jgi:TolA-binding protein
VITRLVVRAALLFVATGCVASKGDIRLLQDELRASRQQQALGDTSILRADEARRNQIAQLSTKLDRTTDTLRAVANRLATLSANINGSFEQIQQQVTQMQAMLSQTTRNLQETRSQVQMLSERGATAPSMPDPNAAPGAAPSGVPGAATLYNTAIESINQGAFATGRRSLEQLLASYPDDQRAPRAMLKIGETYAADRNSAAADSVYRLIFDNPKYAKSDEAGLALYRVGKSLWDSGKRSEGRILLNRVVREHPNTDAARLASETLRS